MITALILLLITGTLAYRNSFLKNRYIFHLSLQQILYLVFLPGIIFILINSYMQSLLTLPLESTILINDTILSDIIFLALFFTYGGISIHAVTKILAHTTLRYSKSDAAEINRYFHLNFSHNLIFGGAIFLVVCLAMLELNHTNPSDVPGMTSLIIRGLIMACSLLYAMFNYTRFQDEGDYAGRWADFKVVFIIAWSALVLIFLALKKTDSSFRQYNLVLPIILTLSLLVSLNIFLILRRIKRHKLYSPYRFIAFHRKKRHPTVQKSQNNFKSSLQYKIEDKNQKV
jgi:hypothetical protein